MTVEGRKVVGGVPARVIGDTDAEDDARTQRLATEVRSLAREHARSIGGSSNGS
jgi:hypothetical protein